MNCFFTESQYSDIPVISPTPNSSKWRKIKSCPDLDLDTTMPNVFKFHVPISISFQVIVQKHTHGTHTHTHTRTHTDAHKD